MIVIGKVPECILLSPISARGLFTRWPVKRRLLKIIPAGAGYGGGAVGPVVWLVCLAVLFVDFHRIGSHPG
jgi:hypothetical protein